LRKEKIGLRNFKICALYFEICPTFFCPVEKAVKRLTQYKAKILLLPALVLFIIIIYFCGKSTFKNRTSQKENKR